MNTLMSFGLYEKIHLYALWTLEWQLFGDSGCHAPTSVAEAPVDGVLPRWAADRGYTSVCWSFHPVHFLQTHLYLEIFKNCYFCRQGSQLMQRLDSDQALFQRGQEGRTEVREDEGLVRFRKQNQTLKSNLTTTQEEPFLRLQDFALVVQGNMESVRNLYDFCVCSCFPGFPICMFVLNEII